MILVKIHKSVDKEILAICDSDLIGKTIEDGDLQLNITERFYKGEQKSKEEIISLMKEVKNINIVGEESINIALEVGIISKESIIKIKKIPHACIFSIE